MSHTCRIMRVMESRESDQRAHWQLLLRRTSVPHMQNYESHGEQEVRPKSPLTVVVEEDQCPTHAEL